MSRRVRALDRRPLAVPAFRRLWIASTAAAVGGSLSTIAVPAQLFALTGSSAAIGWSAAVSFPLLVVAALGSGCLADTTDRRTLLLVAHAGMAISAGLLWAQTVIGLRSVPALLVLVGAQALSSGTILTTTDTVLPRLLPGDLLPAANSLSSLTRYAAAVVGPLLAGALIPVAGLQALYLGDAVTLIAVLHALFRLPELPAPTRPPHRRPDPASPTAPAPPPTSTTTPIGSVLLGFRRLAADRVVSAALAVDVIAMAFGMPAALFPDLARHLSGATASDPADSAMILGLLYAAYPAGVVALGLVSGTFTRLRRPGALLIGAAQLWGLSVILAGLSGNPALTLVALTVGGAANLVLSTCRTTITQTRTDDEVRGRVQGALTVVRFGGPQAAVLLHGLAGSVLGPRLGIGLGGLLTVTGLVLIQVRAPQLWHYGGQTTIAPRRTGGRS